MTVRALPNNGAKVLDRVEAGETLTVIRDGARLLIFARPPNGAPMRRPSSPARGTFNSQALTAAIALANDLPVYTRDPANFAGIPGLTVVALPVGE